MRFVLNPPLANGILASGLGGLAPKHLAEVCSGWRRGDTDDFPWYRRISWLGTCLGTDPKASRLVLHSSYSVMWSQMIFKIKLALAVRFTRLEN